MAYIDTPIFTPGLLTRGAGCAPEATAGLEAGRLHATMPLTTRSEIIAKKRRFRGSNMASLSISRFIRFGFSMPVINHPDPFIGSSRIGCWSCDLT